MPPPLLHEETSGPRSIEPPAAGERLDASLASDRDRRERLQRKWMEKNRRLLRADHWASVGAEWLTGGIAAVGLPAFFTSLALEVTPLRYLVPDHVRFVIHLGGPVALAFLFLVFVLENFTRGMLESVRKVVVTAARAEGVELPAVSSPKSSSAKRTLR